MHMDLLLIGMTLSMMGKVILGICVLSVHAKILKEHKIDGDVLSRMNHERYFAILGISFIIIGYLAEIASFGYFDFLAY